LNSEVGSIRHNCFCNDHTVCVLECDTSFQNMYVGLIPVLIVAHLLLPSI
jgi:hypothetical protein